MISAVKHNKPRSIQNLLGASDIDEHFYSSPDATPGSTALLFAAYMNRDECVKILLENGAGVNETDDAGQTPLMAATIYRSPRSLRLLLAPDLGAKVNLQDKERHTALTYAVHFHVVPAINLLLENEDVSVTLKGKDGHTALTFAVSNVLRDPQIVLSIIEKNPMAIDKPGKGNRTALGWAVHSGNPEIVAILLEKEAKINEIDENGQTALMIACRKGHESIVRLLLARKDIDIHHLDNDGRTALIIVSDSNHFDIAALLMEAGAEDDEFPERLSQQSLPSVPNMYVYDEPDTAFGRKSPAKFSNVVPVATQEVEEESFLAKIFPCIYGNNTNE